MIYTVTSSRSLFRDGPGDPLHETNLGCERLEVVAGLLQETAEVHPPPARNQPPEFILLSLLPRFLPKNCNRFNPWARGSSAEAAEEGPTPGHAPWRSGDRHGGIGGATDPPPLLPWRALRGHVLVNPGQRLEEVAETWHGGIRVRVRVSRGDLPVHGKSQRGGGSSDRGGSDKRERRGTTLTENPISPVLYKNKRKPWISADRA